MCKVIICANQKGGVAKTTSVVNIGVGLARMGKKVLLIDNDPQASLTESLGYQEPDKLPWQCSEGNSQSGGLYPFQRHAGSAASGERRQRCLWPG